jgi:hypothetical protein
MDHRYYVLNGQENLGPCNIVDRWHGRLIFNRVQTFPCGHKMYIGEVCIQQDNCWNFKITEQHDFAFTLECQCGQTIASCPSARAIQDMLGWIYIIPITEEQQRERERDGFRRR